MNAWLVLIPCSLIAIAGVFLLTRRASGPRNARPEPDTQAAARDSGLIAPVGD